MGNTPNQESSSIVTTKILAEAYLYITQDTTQSVDSSQIISLNCSNKKTNELCLECKKGIRDLNDKMRKGGGTKKDIFSDKKDCDDPCNCTIEKVDMKQLINVNFSAIKKSEAKQLFNQALLNSMTNQSTVGGDSTLSFGNNTMDTISKISNNIYDKMMTEDFQSSIQTLKNMQVISLEGPGKIVTVNMTQAIDFVSKVFQSSASMSNSITLLTKTILNASKMMVEQGLGAILVIIAFIALFLFIFSSLTTVITTLASS